MGGPGNHDGDERQNRCAHQQIGQANPRPFAGIGQSHYPLSFGIDKGKYPGPIELAWAHLLLTPGKKSECRLLCSYLNARNRLWKVVKSRNLHSSGDSTPNIGDARPAARGAEEPIDGPAPHERPSSFMVYVASSESFLNERM